MKRCFAVLVCMLALVGGQDAAASPSRSQSVNVDATTYGWQSTSVFVKKNHSVIVTATGSGCVIGNTCFGPGGSGVSLPTYGPYLNAPWVGGPAYALVGMVDGDLVFIGSGPTLVSGSGELYLAFNDDKVIDNSGRFDVSITACLPGMGNGDANRCHTGAPGQS